MFRTIFRFTITGALIAFAIFFVATNFEGLASFFSGAIYLDWWTESKIRIFATIVAGIIAFQGLKTALASYRLNQTNLDLSQKARVAGIGLSWNFNSQDHHTSPKLVLSNANDSLLTIDNVGLHGYGFQNHYFDFLQIEIPPGEQTIFEVPRTFWFDILAMAEGSISTPSDYIDVIVEMRDIENNLWTRDASRSVERGILVESDRDSFYWNSLFSLACSRVSIFVRNLCSTRLSGVKAARADRSPYWLKQLDPLAHIPTKEDECEAERSAIVTYRRLSPGRSKTFEMPKYLSARDVQLAEMYHLLYDPNFESCLYDFYQGEFLSPNEALSAERLAVGPDSALSFASNSSTPEKVADKYLADHAIPNRVLENLLHNYSSLDSSLTVLSASSAFTNQFVSIQSAVENAAIASWLTRNFELLSDRNFTASRKVASITRCLTQLLRSRLHFYNSGVAELWAPKSSTPECVPAVSRYRSDLVVWWPRSRAHLTATERACTISRLEFIVDRDVHPFAKLAMCVSEDGLTFPFPTDVDYSYAISRNERLARDLCNYYGFNSESLDGFRSVVERFAEGVDPDSQVVDLEPLRQAMK